MDPSVDNEVPALGEATRFFSGDDFDGDDAVRTTNLRLEQDDLDGLLSTMALMLLES